MIAERDPWGFELILDSLVCGVLCVDDRLKVVYLNQACQMIFGITPRSCLAQPLTEVLSPLQDQVERLRHCLEYGEGFTEREIQLRNNGMDPVTVDFTVAPFTSANNEKALSLQFHQVDRHMRIAREGHLSTQQEVSRQMIRNLAHEIKNPLGGLRGAAQLLERELAGEDQKEFTRIIIGEADRLQNLVNRLLGPTTPLEKKPVNIHEVVEHVRQLIQTQVSANVRILRDYDPSLPELDADRDRLIQALLNIASNAVNAVGESGTIRFKTRMKRNFTINGHKHKLVIKVDVIDTGPGVSEDMLEKIFYPMVSTHDDGTGLGLSIAQYLVYIHGGLIECDSEPGKTVFSIYLPVS